MSFGSSSTRSVSKTRCDVQIRWLIRRDMPEIMDIERQCFEHPWTEEVFVSYLKQRNIIGMVAERQEQVVGFMIYELLKSRLHIVNFAVATWVRRQGVGSQLIEKLVSQISQHGRQEFYLEVRETNLAAQLFFRSQGLLSNGVLRRHYEDSDEDAYVMRYHLDRDRETAVAWDNGE